MKKFLPITACSLFLWSLCFLLCSAAAIPDAGIVPNEVDSKSSKKIERLEQRQQQAKTKKQQLRIEQKLRKIKYGGQGDALGLAALLGGIVSVLLSLAVMIFLGVEWQLLVYLGLLLGIGAIIFGLVDLRYTDMPGQAWAAIIIGAVGVVLGVVALIVVK